jgi:hypothetical protein
VRELVGSSVATAPLTGSRDVAEPAAHAVADVLHVVGLISEILADLYVDFHLSDQIESLIFRDRLSSARSATSATTLGRRRPRS